LALEGFDAIVIIAVLVVVFLWGPQKVPDIARAIGQAKREFDRASAGLTTAIKQPEAVLAPASSTPAPTQTAVTAPVAPASESTATSHEAIDPLIVAAKSLGISTEGKTKEDIAKEILGSAK
jgi:sec-independent protein translocase protein TatA